MASILVDIGECIPLPMQSKSLLTLGQQTFLKSGTLLTNENLTYPEVYNKFQTRTRNFNNWVDTHDGTENVLRLFTANNKFFKASYIIALDQFSLFVSDDSYTNWERVITPFDSYGTSTFSPINTITYGNGVYAIGGVAIGLYTSPNLKTWTNRYPSGASLFVINKIIFSTYSNTFIAVGTGGFTARSTDGLTWTYTLINSNFNAQDVAFNSVGGALAVGYYVNSNAMQVWYSSNGVSWVNYEYTTSIKIMIKSVSYQASTNLFIASDGTSIFTITGGGGNPLNRTTPLTTTSDNSCTVLSVNDMTYILNSNGEFAYSTDDISWSVIKPYALSAVYGVPKDLIYLKNILMTIFVNTEMVVRSVDNRIVGIASVVPDTAETTYYMRIK